MGLETAGEVVKGGSQGDGGEDKQCSGWGMSARDVRGATREAKEALQVSE